MTRVRALLGSVLLATAVSSASAARADEPDSSPPAPAAGPAEPPADDSEKLTQATELFWEAHSRFEHGEYAAALDLFQQTYAIRPEPEILFNIAVTQQRLGQCEAARASYREYLASAESSNHERARQELEQLDQNCTPAPAVAPPAPEPMPPAAAAATPVAEPAPQLLAPPAPPPRNDSAPEQPASATTREILGWTSLGLATVALGTAVYFEAERRKEADAFYDAEVGEDAAHAYTNHNRARTVAWTTATAAGVLAVTGGFLLLYDPSATTTGGSPRKLSFALSATGRF